MKKFLRGTIFAMAFMMFATQVFAASTWYTCKVNRAGITNYNDIAVVFMTDTAASPAFTNYPFMTAAATLNAQLATALTAASSSGTVYVLADPGSSGLGQIYNIYMNSN